MMTTTTSQASSSFLLLMSQVVPLTLYFIASAFFCRSSWNLILSSITFMIVILCISAVRKSRVGIFELIIFSIFLYFVIRPLQIVDGFSFDYLAGSPAGSARRPATDFFIAQIGAWILLITLYVYYVFTKVKTQLSYIDISQIGVFIVFIIGIALFACFIISSGGYANVALPRYEKQQFDAPWITLFYGGHMATTAILCALWKQKKTTTCGILAAISLTALMITTNPFNAARFSLISAYLPIGLIMIGGRVRPVPFYTLAVLFLFIIMPVLNVTTRTASPNVGFDTTSIDPLRIDFIDAFDMSVENVSYTDLHGYTWGSKLIGDVLFFVPRSIWTNKPTLNGLDVGGAILARRDYGTDNLSMPILSDGYRDYGLAGYLVAALMLVGIVHVSVRRNRLLVGRQPLVEYFVFAAIPIVLRGPFSAVVPIPFFQCLVAIVVLKLIGTKSRPAQTVHQREQSLKRRNHNRMMVLADGLR